MLLLFGFTYKACLSVVMMILFSLDSPSPSGTAYNLCFFRKMLLVFLPLFFMPKCKVIFVCSQIFLLIKQTLKIYTPGNDMDIKELQNTT